MRAQHWSWILGVVLAACSADEPATGGDDGALEPAPPEGGQQLATSTFTLEPGEEKYWCYQFYSPPESVGITRIEQISAPGIHHFALFQAFGRNEPDAPHECDTLIKQTWMPIWVTGTGKNELTLPTGTAFVIAPETQYIIQLHLQNSGDEPLTIRGGVNLTYEHDTASITPAGMFAIGSYDVEIPAQATDHSIPVSCDPGRQMNVFGVFPHMHKIGSKIELRRTPAGGAAESFYKVDPWKFGDAPVDMLTKTVVPTDTFDLTCTFNNPYNYPVTFGESSDNEMCFFVLFYYPYDHLDGCIIGG
jgi:hypothetical protein